MEKKPKGKKRVIKVYFDYTICKGIISVQLIRKIFIPFGQIKKIIILREISKSGQIQCMVEFYKPQSVSVLLSTKIFNNAIFKYNKVNNFGPINYNISNHSQIEKKTFYEYWNLEKNEKKFYGQFDYKKLKEAELENSQDEFSINNSQLNSNIRQAWSQMGSYNQENDFNLTNQNQRLVISVQGVKKVSFLETNKQFLNFFGIFGDVNKIIYLSNNKNGNALVEFYTQKGSENCIKFFENYKYKNHKIIAQFSRDKNSLKIKNQISELGAKHNINMQSEDESNRYRQGYQKMYIKPSKQIMVKSCKNFDFLKETLNSYNIPYKVTEQYQLEGNNILLIDLKSLTNSLLMMSHLGVHYFPDGKQMLLTFVSN